MARRYLFGPVPAAYADQNLHGPRQAGDCLAFNAEGSTDVVIGPADTWETLGERLPAGWRPDFVVLFLTYTSVPACLWLAPVPLVGLAADWNLQWHYYRRRLRDCDLVLTDTLGVEILAQEGVTHARPGNLYGCGRDWVETSGDDYPRDIDLLFVGNIHPAVQRERMPWLGRLARFAGRWRVVLTSGVYGAAYRHLMGRARIIFNHSIRSEANCRAFEAAAAGALLFQETGNREIPAYFRDQQQYVAYTSDNMEALLEYYLEHEEERRGIANAAQACSKQFTFEAFWDDHLGLIDLEWNGIVARAGRRPQRDALEDLWTRTWQMLGSSSGSAPHLVRDLAATRVSGPPMAARDNALGLAMAVGAASQGPVTASEAEAALAFFQRALTTDPRNVMAGLNLTEVLVALQQDRRAIEQARQTLAVLSRPKDLSPSGLEAGHFPPGFDHFHVEWERAAWAHAGQLAAEVRAKQDLVRWRLHTLLAGLTGGLPHFYEAVLARPDLPLTRAALGCALGRQGRPAEAVSHLVQAVAANPFDHDAARALHQALGEVGDTQGQKGLTDDRRLLARAAPLLVPTEPWFNPEAPSASGRQTEGAFCNP